MKATAQVDLIVATDDDLKNILWKETDESLNKIIRTDLTVHSAGVARLASTGSNFTIPFGDIITGKILFISSDVEVGVKIDASATAVTVSPSGSYRGFLMLHGSFASALVVKPSTGTANVRYCVVGLET